mmetsp:Transcript_34852/g.48342  ORF Transcript_34852/g.48342 Transcript_34852/m.48342 type:complete len:523 (-) Transcript_34852:184-1752(-)
MALRRPFSSTWKLFRQNEVLGSSLQKFYSSSIATTRDSKFNSITEEDVTFFRSVVGPCNVVTSASALEGFNQDWMHTFQGASGLALRPTSTTQVQEILQHCNQRRLAVVPQGGNTGLVGGSVPVFDEVVLSTSRLDQVLAFDPVGGILTCQAGCVLETLNEYAEERGFVMPLDLGAKGSCHIGGNVSTNAGGLRVIRHGSLHGSVLGLEVVLPDGQLLDLNRPLRKDNTGLPLHHLFIGAEGTLGVVTAVSLLLPTRPSVVNVALLACSSFQTVQEIFMEARRSLGEIISAVEFFDRASLDLALRHLPGVADPLPADSAPFYVLLETQGAHGEHDTEKLHNFLAAIMSEEELDTKLRVVGGTLAQGAQQQQQLWRIREGITEALARAGAVFKYDLSMPVPLMYELVEEMRARLREEEDVSVVGYGHLGDDNLHLNISAPSERQSCTRLRGLIEPFVYEWTSNRGGSISAEHGIGQAKAQYMPLAHTPLALNLMRRIKTLFDPNGIMNPYKLLPRQICNSVGA